jgi:hypothetical protein
MDDETPLVWPRDEFERLAPFEAAKIGSLIADQTAWVERRVETVELVDETTHRRRVSVHFDVPGFETSPGAPAGVGLMFVPLALVQTGVLRNLDVLDEERRAIPVLTRRQSSTLTAHLLLAQALDVLGAADESALDPNLRWTLRVHAGMQLAEPEPSVTELTDAQLDRLFEDETMAGLLAGLDEQFLLLVRVDARARETRIVKFAYDTEFESPHAGSRPASPVARTAASLARGLHTLAIALGLSDYRQSFRTLSMFDAHSYHVEIGCPDEIAIPAAALSRLEGDVDVTLAKDERTDRAHLYVTAPHPPEAWAAGVVVRFCLRTALVAPVVLLSALTALVIAAGAAVLSWWPGVRTDSAAALVVAVPTLFAPFVAPGAHRLVRRMFVGLRVLALLSGLCSFAAAASLALRLSDATTARIWTVLAAAAGTLAGVAVLALLHSWWRMRAPAERRRGLVATLLAALAAAPALDRLGERSVWLPAEGDWLWSALAYAAAALVVAAGVALLVNARAGRRPGGG